MLRLKTQSWKDAETFFDAVAERTRAKLPEKFHERLNYVLTTYRDILLASFQSILNKRVVKTAGPELRTASARAKANLLAMEIIATKTPGEIDDQDRERLLQYSGWGGLSIKKYKDRFPEGLVPEWEGLINEYYTPSRLTEEVARVLRPLIGAMARGTPLSAVEPSAGIGRFINSLSEAGFESLQWEAVEFSKISARILAALRPDIKVTHGSFEEWVSENEKTVRGKVDVILANPPYGPRGSTAGFDNDAISEQEKRAYTYFLRRGLDLLGPGGLGVYLIPAGFMTSRSTEMRRVRDWILRRFHIGAAFRLPSELFPGANLVTDIIFFKARGGALVEIAEEDEALLEGRYFELHPNHILGEEVNANDSEQADEQAASLKGRWRYKIEGKFERFPEFQWRPICRGCKLQQDKKRSQGSRQVGRKMSVVQGEGAVPEASALGLRVDRFLASFAAGTEEASFLWSDLREGLHGWVTEYGAPKTQQGVLKGAKKGNTSLQRFLQAFESDGSLIEALEKKPVFYDEGDAQSADDIERLAWALYRRQAGKVRLGELNQHNKVVGGFKDFQDVLEEIINEGWAVDGDANHAADTWLVMPPETYYTGELWPKYDRALGLEKAGYGWARIQKDRLLEAIGIIAIEAVDGISPHHGWIPLEIIQRWLNESLGSHYSSDLELFREHGVIQVEGIPYEDMPSMKRVEHLISRDQRDAIGWLNHDRNVFKPQGAKEEKVQLLRDQKSKDWEESFHRWALAHDDLKQRLQIEYNRKFRGWIDRQYPGDHLPISRWNTDKIRLHPWQASGARRVIGNGGGLVAFDVGVGKTFTALAIVAMSRQLGYSKRPVIVVPNSIIWKWFEDARKVLPDFRVGIIGSKKIQLKSGPRKGHIVARPDTPEERGRKWTKFQTGGYDLCLVTYTALQRTQVNEAEVLDYVMETEAIQREIRLSIKRSKNKKKDSEREEAVFRQRISRWVQDKIKIQKGWRYDTGVAWDDIGIDMLIIDEAQNFKNLYLPEPRDGSSPPKFMGNAGDGSKRAWQLDFRCNAVRKRASNGTGIVLLSATPAKNSPLEFYNLLQFIDHDIWKRMGISNPEEFIDRYCEIELRMTMDLQGAIQDSSSCVGFKNLEELRGVLHRFGDFKNPEDLKKPDGSPALELPKPLIEVVTVPMSLVQAEKYADYRQEMKDMMSKSGFTNTGSAILGIMARMALITIHPDLNDFTTDDPDDRISAADRWSMALSEDFDPHSPKIDACVENVLKNRECGHIIFVENVAIHAFVRRVLVERGLPEARIAVLNSIMAKDTALRQEIAKDFNGDADEGRDPKYDVVIANQIAYEGIDLQARTCAIHHLDLPWEPATLAQRNGRGVRQGNKLEAISIFYYFAEGSADSYRFQQIDGKRNWMVSLLKEADREINNPAAQQDFAGDVLAFLAGSEEEAREQFQKAKEKFQKDEKARQAKTAARKLPALASLFRRAERMSGPNADALKAQGMQQLEALLNRLDGDLWPWIDLARRVETKELLVPASPEATAPVFEGMRARIAQANYYGSARTGLVEFGAVRRDSNGNASIAVRLYKTARVQWLNQKSFDSWALDEEGDPVSSGAVAVRSRDDINPAEWSEDEDSKSIRESLKSSSGQFNLRLLEDIPEPFFSQFWPIYLEENLKTIMAHDPTTTYPGSITGKDPFTAPVVVEGKLTIQKRGGLGKGRILPPSDSGWREFLDLVPASGVDAEALEDVAYGWWKQKRDKAYFEKLGKEAKKNPCGPCSGLKRNPRGAIDLDYLEEQESFDDSFEAAVDMTEQRYGTPTEAIEIEPIPGASKFLTPVGELVRLDYLAADAEGEPITRWFHDAGDQGEGKRKTKAPILAWDPINEQFYLAQPKGADLRFTQRGVVG